MMPDPMTDRDFETQLFALYGTPAAEWADAGVTDRVIREIDREMRVRRQLLTAAGALGIVVAMVLLGAFAAPLVAAAARIAGASLLTLWALLFAVTASLGWAAARLAADT